MRELILGGAVGGAWALRINNANWYLEKQKAIYNGLTEDISATAIKDVNSEHIGELGKHAIQVEELIKQLGADIHADMFFGIITTTLVVIGSHLSRYD